MQLVAVSGENGLTALSTDILNQAPYQFMSQLDWGRRKGGGGGGGGRNNVRKGSSSEGRNEGGLIRSSGREVKVTVWSAAGW